MKTHSVRNLAILGAFAWSLVAAGARAADPTHDFARYQVIIDHAPFGAVGAAAMEVQQPSFSTRYTFVGTVQESEDEPVLAIILDNQTKHVEFKPEGESLNEAKVVKIERSDTGPTKLVLKQGLEVATLLLESKAAGAPGSAGPPPGMPAVGGEPPVPTPAQLGGRRIPFRRGG